MKMLNKLTCLNYFTSRSLHINRSHSFWTYHKSACACALICFVQIQISIWNKKFNCAKYLHILRYVVCSIIFWSLSRYLIVVLFWKSVKKLFFMESPVAKIVSFCVVLGIITKIYIFSAFGFIQHNLVIKTKNTVNEVRISCNIYKICGIILSLKIFNHLNKTETSLCLGSQIENNKQSQ